MSQLFWGAFSLRYGGEAVEKRAKYNVSGYFVRGEKTGWDTPSCA